MPERAPVRIVVPDRDLVPDTAALSSALLERRGLQSTIVVFERSTTTPNVARLRGAERIIALGRTAFDALEAGSQAPNRNVRVGLLDPTFSPGAYEDIPGFINTPPSTDRWRLAIRRGMEVFALLPEDDGMMTFEGGALFGRRAKSSLTEHRSNEQLRRGLNNPEVVDRLVEFIANESPAV